MSREQAEKRDAEKSSPRAGKRKRKGTMLKLALSVAAGVLAGTVAFTQATLAQEKPDGPQAKVSPAMNAQEPAMQHQHGEIPLVQPEFPQMGRAQERAGGQAMTLAQAEAAARESNPTVRQAEAEIRAAKARQQQAGLYPNPAVGYTGDEIRGGSVGGGKQGFFAEQTLVTAGKLGKSRAVFGSETKLAEMEAEEQRTRVESAVKIAFLRVLAAQERLDTQRDLARLAEDAAQVQKELMNTGQADESEVLEAEIEAERMRMAARMQENTLREEWRSLAAVIGKPEMAQMTVAGNLERDWPELNEEEVVEAIAKQSPAVRIAETAQGRAQALLARAQSQAIPDVQLRAGMEYNHETLASVPFAKGWEGLAEARVEIPLFDRNQGNIAAARAEEERAEEEKSRVGLTLRERAAPVVDQYANEKLMVLEYRDEILPNARKAYSLMVDKYGQMLASRPRVLDAQRKLFEMQLEYIAALEGVWTNGLALQGYLLTDGLEGPARPGEVDLPIRETNVPVPERSMSPGEAPPRP